jgi:hypothetical protein
VAANPAPNKKRLAPRSQRPHRPHLTWRRKIPVFLWGAFSTPGLNAGEESWKGGITYFLWRHPEQARHVGLDKNDLLMEVPFGEASNRHHVSLKLR